MLHFSYFRIILEYQTRMYLAKLTLVLNNLELLNVSAYY